MIGPYLKVDESGPLWYVVYLSRYIAASAVLVGEIV